MWTGLCGLFALAVLVLVSPHKWRAPWACLAQYVVYPFTRKSILIATYYLGKNYTASPPWHYFDLMSLWTYPPLLWLALQGVWFARRRHGRLLAALAFPLAFWTFLGHWPTTPKHDGVRQFVSFYPLLGLASWAGLRGLWESAVGNFPALGGRGRSVAGAFVVLLAMPLLRIHPLELSYYNAFIGGLPGGSEKARFLSSILRSRGSTTFA